jgi:tetratricopeptide (TPR) repeat protein
VKWDEAWVRVAGAAIVLALAVRAFNQAGIWQNDPSLFEHALAVNPRSALSRTNLATYLYAHNDPDGAVGQLEQAVRDDPDYAFARLDFAQLLVRQGRVDEAAEQYRQLLRIYSTQRNYDPKLAEDTQIAIDALLSRSRRSATTRSQTP